MDVAVRLLKGWRRARGRNAPIGSFALETAVVNRVIGARRIPALDELVFGFFDCPADHDKRRRLVLSGQATDAPVTLIDPASGNNLTEGLDHDGKKALIDAACRARGELTRIQSLAEEKPGPAMTALRKLFVG
ncbi:MAG: hypothetical protein H6745_25695 [Deltaproteobacteria bacterium]|nr:hypothetical protein [Deltaproteobacteria bacterium]